MLKRIALLSGVVAICAVIVANIYSCFIEDNLVDNSCRMADGFADKKSQFQANGMRAFVVGATGEVGKEVVKILLKEKLFSKLVLFGRRTVNYEDDLFKDVEQKVINFDKLEDHVEDFKGFDVGYSSLGTTRGKSGADGFYKVDHDYVVNTAKLARDGGCKQIHLVSSVGANKNSMLLYPKTKGEVEEELKAMKFDNLFIYRPGLLMCDRQERRFFEKAFMVLTRPITYTFPTIISIPTETVAMAMVNRTISAVPGSGTVEVIENKQIHQHAKCE